jgi:3-oxoadipate enol-lactonase
MKAMGLHLEIERAGDGAPWIVFGNSLLTDLSLWDEVVRPLGRRFNLLRYDQRGHGRSAVPSHPLAMAELGADLTEVLDAAGVGRCLYVGLSMGVPTGLAALARAPGRFGGLILVDGQAKSAATGAAFWQERIALARAEGMAGLAEATVRRWLRPERLGTPMAERLRAIVAATPLEGFVAAASALKSYDESAVLGRIAVPTLLVAGAEDGAMPDTMRTMAAAIPKGRFVAIAEAGHVPVFERPDAFLAAIAEALDVWERDGGAPGHMTGGEGRP